MVDVPARVWRIAEAKARLSEILRLADTEGPQRIGVRRAYVVVPEAMWRAKSESGQPLGQWLVDNMPRGTDLEQVLPSRSEPERAAPFADHEE